MPLEMITLKGNILIGFKMTIINLSKIEAICYSENKMHYISNGKDYFISCTKEEYDAFYGLVFSQC